MRLSLGPGADTWSVDLGRHFTDTVDGVARDGDTTTGEDNSWLRHKQVGMTMVQEPHDGGTVRSGPMQCSQHRAAAEWQA